MSYWEHRKPVQRERAVDIAAVARVAVALLDTGGPRALTLRAVATRLGVAPASLYSRVESVDDLFDLALDAALGEDPDVGSAIAESELDDLMLVYYRHLLDHPWACQVIAMRAPRGPTYLRLSERMCELLIADGAPDPLGAAYALSNFVIGSAATARAAENEPRAPIDPAVAPNYARLHTRSRGATAERTVIAGLTALRASLGRAVSRAR